MDEVIDRGQQQSGQRQRQHKGQQDGQQGFGQELADQRSAEGAGDFTDADLLCAERCFGGGKVDVVDAGDDDDEKPDDGKDIDIERIAIGFDLPLQVRTEVDIGQRLGVEDIFPFFVVLM